MERREQGGGKEEESEIAQNSRKAGKMGGCSARDISSLGFAVFLLPCLKARGVCCDAVCKRLLAAIPELAWALTAGRLEVPCAPLLGLTEHQHHLRQRGRSSATNKGSQTAELAGKLGAVTEQVSSGHTCIHW